MSEGVTEEDERFSMHGLKHRGVIDTERNRGRKQGAAGYKLPTTAGRYDHDMPIVKPPRRREFFRQFFRRDGEDTWATAYVPVFVGGPIRIRT